MLTCPAEAGTTSAELRRQVEANSVNWGVFPGFFTEAKGLAENDQKVKFPLYGRKKQILERHLRKSENDNWGKMLCLQNPESRVIKENIANNAKCCRWQGSMNESTTQAAGHCDGKLVVACE